MRNETSKLAGFDLASEDTNTMIVTTATRRDGTKATTTSTCSIIGGRSVTPLVVDIETRNDMHPQTHSCLVSCRSSYHGTFARKCHMALAATIIEQFIECLAKFAISTSVHVRVAHRIG